MGKDIDTADLDAKIVAAVKAALNKTGEDRWDVVARKMPVDAWSDITRHAQSLAPMVRRGYSLMHSVEARAAGAEPIMWLHFAVKKAVLPEPPQPPPI